MNGSKENDVFLRICKVAEVSLTVINQFPNKKYEHNQIVTLVINCMLLCSTISLNGISVVTIRKSSQLRSKVCYFVILLQSIVDLGVGLLGIPLFLYVLIAPFRKIQNCTVIFLVLRASYLPLGLSVATLSAMPMERYIGVLYPYQYQAKITKKRILFYLGANGLALLSLLIYSQRDRRPLIHYGGGSIFLHYGGGSIFPCLVIQELIRDEKRRVRVDDEIMLKGKLFVKAAVKDLVFWSRSVFSFSSYLFRWCHFS